jgi:S-(hydroxymethyl)glutathione dehydrogenase/alcohol dehydrogenase
MKTEAAILVETGMPLALAPVATSPLKPGQVLVEIAYSGVCHTQILEARGKRGPDRFLPHGLGHEGSGVVVETGAAVTKVKAGDKVVLSWIKAAGHDVPGTTYDWNGRTVNAGAVTTFQRHAVVSENRVSPLPSGVGLREAVLFGCALPTGFGSVFNVARPSPGESLAVFGCGGVGLCAVCAARIAGAAPVVAVDVLANKLNAARKLGATDTIDASATDPIEALRGLVPGGVDFAIEATGKPAIMSQALDAVRNQGGAAVVVGNAAFGETIALNPLQLNLGKQLRGTWGGDAQPDRDFPRFARLGKQGQLPFDILAPTSYALADIDRALDDLEAGRVLRPVIDMKA